jgi:hypothetical protein
MIAIADCGVTEGMKTVKNIAPILLIFSIIYALGGVQNVQAIVGQYSSVGESRDGLRLVSVLQSDGESRLWAYIDEEGKLVTPICFESAYDFENRQAIVCEAGNWKQIGTGGDTLLTFDPS